MFEWTKVQYPDDVGISSKGILKMLDRIEELHLEYHSIIVIKDGKYALRLNFAPYDDVTPHQLYSLSKTFTSIAAGFAVSEGLLDWNSKVCEVLSEDAPENPSDWLKSVTLHHLLTMGSGLRPESDNINGKDWAKQILAYDCDYEPGTHFHYNSHGTYLVSCMVQKVTGMTVRDYLMPRLFTPLGIEKPCYDMSPEQINCGGWGLHITSDDIAKLALCLLNKGMWEGRQLIPCEWYERATTAHIDNSNGNPDPANDWHQGYGYQIWRTKHNRFRGDGMHGQLCVVSPDDNMAVAVTAGIEDMQGELNVLHDYLFPSAYMEPATQEEKDELQRRIAVLGYKWPENNDNDLSKVIGTYICNGVSVTIEQDSVVVITDDKTLRFGVSEPVNIGNPLSFGGFVCQKDIGFISKAGIKGNTLNLVVRSLDGPFAYHGSIVFGDTVDYIQYGPGFGYKKLELTKKA